MLLNVGSYICVNYEIILKYILERFQVRMKQVNVEVKYAIATGKSPLLHTVH